MNRSRSYVFGILISVMLICPLAWANEDNEDSDGDGLIDLEEARVHRTDSQLTDTDTDGLADGLEVNEYWTLPLVADTDGDGFLDGIEVRLGTDPTEPASYPNPETPNFNDLDGDGISNKDEKVHGTDAQRVDTDFDGLNDYAEIRDYFTNPLAVDTDGDGFWDGEEVKAGADPGDAENSPKTPDNTSDSTPKRPY